MTNLARSERRDLADLALKVGPDEPTLCGEWRVRELIAHLILREGSPLAAGIVVPGLGGMTEQATRRLAQKDFARNVERFRSGAPFYSPFAIGKVDALANAMEFFIHHEDIRRAQPDWEPRELPDRYQNALWKAARGAARGLLRNVNHGVLAVRSDTGQTAVLKSGEPSVVIQGLPAEIALFVYGRKDQAHVELTGPEDLVSHLKGADLGI